MFDLWDGVFALRQPCLRKPASPDMLNENGHVRREILSAIDRLLLTDVVERATVASFHCQQLEITPDQRWINTSAMQKAIRRGQADRAARHCLAGWSIDRRHTFRRLATCALEDVGIGDVQLTSLALAVLGSTALQNSEHSATVAGWLAYRLATSPKSRLACDLLSVVDYDPRLSSDKAQLSGAPHELLLKLSAHGEPRRQMLALWMAAGTRRFAGVTMPAQNHRHRGPLMAHMAASEMPLLLYYVADRAAARLSDAMFVSVLPIWNLMKSLPEVDLEHRLVPMSQDIGPFAPEAFDLHTRTGKRALSRLATASSEIASILQPLAPRQKQVAIEHGVFIAEGRISAVELSSPCLMQIAQEAGYCELSFPGLTDVARQQLGCIRSSLPLLNKLRADASAAA